MLTPENIESIREEFAAMQTKEDLLTLLNFIAYPSLRKPGFLPKDIDPISEGESEGRSLADSLTALFNSSKTVRQKRITSKQLNYFSTSFNVEEKKRKRYHRFYLLKKSGKYREIHAPVPKLNQIQRCIHQMLQTVYTPQSQAYGFVADRSIADNAAVHAGSKFILNVDLKDFFPSVHFRRIKVMLESPPFNLRDEREPLAYLIANLCTENGVLPQGAPTSPFFTNVVCQRMDVKLERLANQFRARYSRYADDLTFSAADYVFTKRFMQKLEEVIKGERFQINVEKTRLQGKAYRQEVTGLTVNEKVNVNKHYFRSYRTMLHLYKSKGPLAAFDYHYKRMPESVAKHKLAKKVLSPTEHIQNVIWGKYLFLKMVKGDGVPEPHFSRNRYAKILMHKSISLLNKMNENGDQTESETESNKSKSRPLPTVQTILISSSSENTSLQEQTPGVAIIEKILATWDKEGFDKAIELLKNDIK